MKKVTLQFPDEIQLVQFMYNKRFSWYHRDNEKHAFTSELDSKDIQQATELYGATVVVHQETVNEEVHG